MAMTNALADQWSGQSMAISVHGISPGENSAGHAFMIFKMTFWSAMLLAVNSVSGLQLTVAEQRMRRVVRSFHLPLSNR